MELIPFQSRVPFLIHQTAVYQIGGKLTIFDLWQKHFVYNNSRRYVLTEIDCRPLGSTGYIALYLYQDTNRFLIPSFKGKQFPNSFTSYLQKSIFD